MGDDEKELNLKATELRLGLPGTDDDRVRSNKRGSADAAKGGVSGAGDAAAKAQIVGWPPIRSFRKNSLLQGKKASEGDGGGIFVKVSMDGAPYLRKIDLKIYAGYEALLRALEGMFRISIGEYSERDGYGGSEYEPTYEDKDGDWMLVGDVPWEMFVSSCIRLRIMKESEATGPRS